MTAAALALLYAGLVVVLFLTAGEWRGRRRSRRRLPERATACGPDFLLRGTTVFVERLDSWSVGVDCLLTPPDAGPGLPVRLRMACPLVRWHQATVLVAAIVDRWIAGDDTLAVAVGVADGRAVRARLSCGSTAVVLDVENGGAVRCLLDPSTPGTRSGTSS